MADSNMTKQAMAATFKEMLREQPFEKISVSDICDRCHMNRKSFYYHFKDKFDLANWIFDTEIVELTRANEIDMVGQGVDLGERMEDLAVFCSYFYENRQFYRQLLRVEGQNSFLDHFRDFIHPILHKRFQLVFGRQDAPQMVYDFIADGMVCMVERWLMEKDCITAEAFLNNLKTLIQILLLGLSRRMQENPRWLRQILPEEIQNITEDPQGR